MILKIASKSVELDLNPDLEQLADLLEDDQKFMTIVQAFGGSSLYFPHKISRELENMQIQAEFDELIRLPNLSRNRVYEILGDRFYKSSRWIREIVSRGSAA